MKKYIKIIKDDLEKRIVDIDIDNVIEQYSIRKKSIIKLNKKIDKISFIKQKINSKRQKVMKLLNNDNSVSNFMTNRSYVILDDIDILENYLEISNMVLDNYKTIKLDNYNTIINDFNKIIYSIKVEDNIDTIINITVVINMIQKFNNLILNESIIISNYEKYKLIETKRNQINYKLEFINKQIDINIINENCNVCIKRKPIYDSFIKQRDELTKEYDSLYYDMTWNSDYIDLQNNKKILNDCINKYNIYRKQLCNIIVDNYENPMSIDMMNNYNIILDYIEHVKNNIKFVKNMDAIKKITKLDSMLEQVDIKLSGYNKELTQLTYELALYKSQYDEYNNIRDNMKKNSTKYNIYSALKKASHINGVPSKIISTRLN